MKYNGKQSTSIGRYSCPVREGIALQVKSWADGSSWYAPLRGEGKRLPD